MVQSVTTKQNNTTKIQSAPFDRPACPVGRLRTNKRKVHSVKSGPHSSTYFIPMFRFDTS